MEPDSARTCFVIMPFGVKRDAAGTEVDFDAVYETIIRPSAAGVGFAPLRCDEIQRAGSIHRDMFQHIAVDELAIVDITMLNPNVFYELGVRHALRPSITILVKQRDVVVPFNIQGQRLVEYPPPGEDPAQAMAAISAFIAAGGKSSEPDSPIFSILAEARKDWKAARIEATRRYRYRLRQQPEKEIEIITGDIRHLEDIAVWVNSENTNLQMSRFFDRSLSAMIRYEGALKDDNGEILRDLIAEELAEIKGPRESVSPGSVYVTGAGALSATHGVKNIFHAATVFGAPGTGYQSIPAVERCVERSLQRMDQLDSAEQPLRSIVFPMLGTGAGGGSVYEVAPKLLSTAVNYLRQNPHSRANRICFSAWNHRDKEACQMALGAMDEIEAIPEDLSRG
jgi:O-acetyl-ADP-ribose deacetylase (regulator of RNase III)